MEPKTCSSCKHFLPDMGTEYRDRFGDYWHSLCDVADEYTEAEDEECYWYDPLEKNA